MLLMFKVTLYTFTCLLFAKSTVGQICASATNCTECIQLPASCVWCAQPDYTIPSQRCIERSNMASSGCNMIEDPMGSSTVRLNESFGGDDFVQVAPQRFDLNLRPGEPQTVEVKVSPARNFPVDVYYLMDLSFSMNDDLDNLQGLADDLATTIRNITENFQLGFGSFVDKRLVPYISVEPSRLSDPCQEDGVRCERTYSTRHSLSLTNDATLFASRINEQIISGNLDSPEGGLDALLQVIVCRDIIGWRERARRIIVFLTDAGFHFAGDGKLGGVVLPNDGKCHLEQDGLNYFYTMAETLDYPSVGQLNSLLQEFDIIPIFAAEAAAMSFYSALQSVIPTAFVGTLATDSSNVVELIRTSYDTISQTVTLNADDVAGITVGVSASCPNEPSPDGVSCTGVLIEDVATFNVSVTIQSCTDELMSEDGVNITVRIPGFGQFVMGLHGVCDCDCTTNETESSDFCNLGNGTLICGQCDCDEEWVGDTCECASNNISVTDCPMGTNNITCTSPDRGTCVCSTCQCNTLDEERRYFGPACECDNFSCDLNAKGLVCGGPTQGMCSCDQTCICLSGWTGRACDCDLTTDRCVSSLGDICSDRGDCMCGECNCDSPRFSGQFCEICTGSDCENPECIAFQDCAICASNPDAVNCSTFNCSTSNVDSVGSVNTATYRIDGTTRTSFCRVTQGDCAYQYFVGTSGSTITRDNAFIEVMAADCGEDEEGVEPWIIIVAILSGLILLAILILIIIRVIIELRYCVEFSQWKRELERARFAKNDNPLFQKATEDFVNPAYGK